jgi:hypothetical protein
LHNTGILGTNNHILRLHAFANTIGVSGTPRCWNLEGVIGCRHPEVVDQLIYLLTYQPTQHEFTTVATASWLGRQDDGGRRRIGATGEGKDGSRTTARDAATTTATYTTTPGHTESNALLLAHHNKHEPAGRCLLLYQQRWRSRALGLRYHVPRESRNGHLGYPLSMLRISSTTTRDTNLQRDEDRRHRDHQGRGTCLPCWTRQSYRSTHRHSNIRLIMSAREGTWNQIYCHLIYDRR